MPRLEFYRSWGEGSLPSRVFWQSAVPSHVYISHTCWYLNATTSTLPYTEKTNWSFFWCLCALLLVLIHLQLNV